MTRARPLAGLSRPALGAVGIPGRFGALPVLLFTVLSAVGAAAFETEFRTLGLGKFAAELPTEGYEAFACGSDGGPPLKPIGGWTDYALCAPDSNGLHEVTTQFGRRIGQISEMFRERYGEELWLQKYGGTRMANFPVVLSLLFDDDGMVRVFRVVTDARAALEDRGRAYLFRFFVLPMYGSDGWDCTERDPAPGESGVGDVYLNEVCTKAIDGKRVRIEAHFFRKPGQTGTDSQGMFEPGQYESLTRWEVFDASLPQFE